jgi:hypothetical protein
MDDIVDVKIEVRDKGCGSSKKNPVLPPGQGDHGIGVGYFKASEMTEPPQHAHLKALTVADFELTVETTLKVKPAQGDGQFNGLR